MVKLIIQQLAKSPVPCLSSVTGRNQARIGVGVALCLLKGWQWATITYLLVPGTAVALVASLGMEQLPSTQLYFPTRWEPTCVSLFIAPEHWAINPLLLAGPYLPTHAGDTC